jgi:hypothetical protein
MSDRVKVKAPEGCTGFSWGGEEFKVNKKGFAMAPAEALEDLRPHGIRAADEEDEQEKQEQESEGGEQKDA